MINLYFLLPLCVFASIICIVSLVSAKKKKYFFIFLLFKMSVLMKKIIYIKLNSLIQSIYLK